MKILFVVLILGQMLAAGVFGANIVPQKMDKEKLGIRILDQKELSFLEIDGVKFSEISDLAYDKKAKSLFMVSDEGKLFEFKAVFADKIKRLEPQRAGRLLKKNGKKFKKWRRDSEGMTLDRKGRLLISFEEKPKIGWFHKNSDKYGRLIKKYELPKKLRSMKRFRSKNKGMESLAWHPKYGILTALEYPPKGVDKKRQSIYALSGKEWHFKAEPEVNSAISAIEVMDDGNILVLERSFTGYMNPFVVTLKKVYIDRCKKRVCPAKVLAKMNSHKGWDVDNFEGLAKVGKHRYVMISDDNDNFFQKTLLIYFEVKEK
ncbi:esterase-like activity of phytase family protein [Sulfurovum sp. NBC37-1]|uniref:esterase-like activity of phytase family protein n=1 Tax=Sulfurovum sp. (strain NBC37-1) TaxID=387093 RepID=UPI0001587792|nr:esterase-like activity of phytase family protein [Sulfurovum sp. NBC37-1]BAF71027.1 conserved hypothetical protein [Sulfurovum sp. NBC37-1]